MKIIDPRTTRRTVAGPAYERNPALYGQYRVINSFRNPATGQLEQVVLEKKPELCGVKS
jgi:hypothetical protein